MNKHTFYKTLHKELGKKYRLEERAIYFIRSAMIGRCVDLETLKLQVNNIIRRKITALENLERATKTPQLHTDYVNTLRNIKSMKRMQKFLQGCSNEELSEILKNDFQENTM